MLYRGDFVYHIKVFEKSEGNITTILRGILAGNALCKICTGTDFNHSYHLNSFSLGIIPPSEESRFLHYDKIGCETLLAPSTFFSAGSSIHTSRVVSYGFSHRDSLTLSSISEEKIVITIQRELFTLDGNILERQEIPIKNTGSPIDGLASASALMLLGIAPESLSLRTGNHIKTIF